MDNLCTTLPNLVAIVLQQFKRCQQLPSFSQLHFLKRLYIGSMEGVEYMESGVCGVPSSTEIEARFFPSLEQLHLNEMNNLKGWWKEVESSVRENDTSRSASYGLVGQQLPRRFMQFSKLSSLEILGCPKLRILPLCPNVEYLSLVRANETLSVLKMAKTLSSSEPPSSSTGSRGSGLKLKKLAIDNTEDLMSLPNHCLHQLSSIIVRGDSKLESTERLGDVFATLSSSLRSLIFHECNKLRSIAKGLEHLTALEHLQLIDCEELDVTGNEEAGDDEGMPWKAFNTSLLHLTLRRLPKLVGLSRGLRHLANFRSLELSGNRELEELPEWISCFSSLEYLHLNDCTKLTSLPEAFRQLTSLKHLIIIDCPVLEGRCQGPNGSDWPKIQHIPLLQAVSSEP